MPPPIMPCPIPMPGPMPMVGPVIAVGLVAVSVAMPGLMPMVVPVIAVGLVAGAVVVPMSGEGSRRFVHVVPGLRVDQAVGDELRLGWPALGQGLVQEE